MNIFRKQLKHIVTGIAMTLLTGVAAAVPLKENSAYVNQTFTVPDMSIVIKRDNGDNSGCNASLHEKWDPAAGGCSNTEYLKENAQVISVAASSPTMSIAVSGPSLVTATVRTKDGQLVGAGVPVSWSTSLGALSAYSGVTNASSQMSVTLAAPKGTAEGLGTIVAAAKGGGASTGVSFYNSAKVASLTATPTSVLADGTSHSTLVASLIYENGASVGSGEALSWTTNLGSFTYAEGSTNANGQAIAYIVSSTPGVATPQATRNISASTAVTFNSPAPVAPIINSLTEFASADGRFPMPNTFIYDDSGASRGYAFGYQNLFTWSVSGADRYELISPNGQILYSGSATSWQNGDNDYFNTSGTKNKKSYNWTLRAYRGSVYTDAVISLMMEDRGCWSCGT